MGGLKTPNKGIYRGEILKNMKCDYFLNSFINNVCKTEDCGGCPFQKNGTFLCAGISDKNRSEVINICYRLICSDVKLRKYFLNSKSRYKNAIFKNAVKYH